MSETSATSYQCPGEPYTISRAVHLGRLANFYAKCRACPHRHDTGTLAKSQVARLAAAHRRPLEPELFTDDGFAGVYLNDFVPARVKRFAAALGVWLQRRAETATKTPSVLIAGDGRSLSPELVAAAGEGLRWSGCDAIDLGAGTAPLVSFAIDYLQADGGLLIGNPAGQPQTAGARCWGPRARPLSAGGGLDELRELTASPLDRPRRRWGRLERRDVRAAYLATLAPYYHALRPLRLILDTSCLPLIDSLRELTRSLACEVIPGHDLPALPLRSTNGTAADHRTWLPDRLAMLAKRIRGERVHFGIWIDGDGDACHVLDERGVEVGAVPLLRLLAAYLIEQGATERTVIVEGTTEPAPSDWAEGLRLVAGDGPCEAMYAAMGEHGALIGGGVHGRWWYRDASPRSDALKTLTLLLCILSQSDRPLSEVATRVDGRCNRG